MRNAHMKGETMDTVTGQFASNFNRYVDTFCQTLRATHRGLVLPVSAPTEPNAHRLTNVLGMLPPVFKAHIQVMLRHPMRVYDEIPQQLLLYPQLLNFIM